VRGLGAAVGVLMGEGTLTRAPAQVKRNHGSASDSTGLVRRLTLRKESPMFPGMKGEFTAIIETAPEGGYWAIARRCRVPTGRVKRSRRPSRALARRSN